MQTLKELWQRYNSVWFTYNISATRKTDFLWNLFYFFFIFSSRLLSIHFLPPCWSTACFSSPFAVVYIYNLLICSFLLHYFSPCLPFQAAVAVAAKASAATTATTAGASGGASGSPSPGPASHNIPSVNEGTDWTEGHRLGKLSQPYLFIDIFSF